MTRLHKAPFQGFFYMNFSRQTFGGETVKFFSGEQRCVALCEREKNFTVANCLEGKVNVKKALKRSFMQASLFQKFR